MPSLITRLKTLAKNPQASSAIAKAREQAAKPENRRRIEQLRVRVGRKP